MKKIYLLMVGVLFLFSCEQSELDFVRDNSTEVASANTRSASSIADFDPIDELREIPVNIKNVGNTKNKFLSCVSKGTKVDLFNKDDGSLRQRWYIKWGNIFLVGGNTSLPITPEGHIAIKPALSGDIPNLSFGVTVYGMKYHTFISFGNYYYIQSSLWPTDPFLPIKQIYLQSNSINGTDLKYKEANNTNLALWEIVPVGEFEIVNMEYVQTSVDNLTPKEVICARDEYTNTSSSTVTWDYSVVTKYSEKSDFSKTEGVTMGITGGLKVGLPNLLGVINLETNMSVQQQTNKSWTYGESSTKDITETRTGHIPVPPNTTIKLDATLVMYEGNLTYVATLRKVGDSKTFKVKGKWNGTCFSMFKAKTYDAKSRSLLGVYSLE